ncbi:MAG: ABC transporter substrate-binding protein [Candidatus Rokuibacteriota bacterium]
MRLTRPVRSLTIAAVALAIAGPAAAEDIVLGVIAPLTGSKAEQGMQFKEGAELAVADLNRAGGVLGRQVRLEILDDEGQPKNAVAAAQKLAANRSVVGVIGPSSTASCRAALPILERAKLVTISPSASTASLVTDHKYMYLMSPAIPFYGPLVPRFAQQELGAKKIAIVKVKDDWGLGVSRAAREYAQQHGMTVVAEVEYAQGDRDFKTHITAVKDKGPDVVILNTHYTEGAIITKQARELGLTVPIVAQGTNVYPQYVEIAGQAAEGSIGWVDFLASLDDPGVKRAVARFQEAYGTPPLNYHITSYDGVHVIADAIKKVGNTEDREAIARTVGQLRDFSGLVGKVSYDAQRLPVRELFWTVVKDGKWVLYRPTKFKM